jgi:hypothetical protein
MSYVTALPAMLASAAGELQSIGSYPPDFRPTDTRPLDTSRRSYTCWRWVGHESANVCQVGG